VQHAPGLGGSIRAKQLTVTLLWAHVALWMGAPRAECAVPLREVVGPVLLPHRRATVRRKRNGNGEWSTIARHRFRRAAIPYLVAR
jgi:hypothetical protein